MPSLDEKHQHHWILVKDANSGSQSRPTEKEVLGIGSEICVLTRPLGNCDTC